MLWPVKITDAFLISDSENLDKRKFLSSLEEKGAPDAFHDVRIDEQLSSSGCLLRPPSHCGHDTVVVLGMYDDGTRDLIPIELLQPGKHPPNETAMTDPNVRGD